MHGIAQRRVAAGGMIDVVADQARLDLDARGAVHALLAVGLEGARADRPWPPSTSWLRQTASSIAMQAPCAMYCSVGWAASPSSVTRPSRPIQDRIAIAQHPQLPVAAVLDDLLRARARCAWKPGHHLVVADRLAGDRLGRIVVAGDDEIEDLPARQRIVDDVALGPGPQRRRVPAQVLGHLLGRDDRAVGGVAGHARRAVADELRADARPQAVGADQPARLRPSRRIFKMARPTSAAVLLVADHLARRCAARPAGWRGRRCRNTPCRSPRWMTA